MALVCTHATLATVEDLMRYKAEGIDIPDFADTSDDQWGIKTHNRPWVVEHGRWSDGQKIIELGGAYSRLSEWIADRYRDVEPWLGDDFGAADGRDLWSRWGNPQDLPAKAPTVTYQFENFGPGSSYPTGYFDRLFSVSTLEHIPPEARVDVLGDAHRTLAPGGIELHTVDVRIPLEVWQTLAAGAAERVGLTRLIERRYRTGIAAWWRTFCRSGVDMSHVKRPSSFELLSRGTLVESPDVVLRFYPPNGLPKPYRPSASLLLIIEDR